MKARFAQVCAAITVAVFAVVTIFFVLRLSEAYERSVENGRTHFAALSEVIAGAYEAADHSFEKFDWEKLGNELDLTRATGAVVVASGQGQLEYLSARDMGYLNPTTRLQLEGNQVSQRGQGVHYLLPRSTHELRLTESLSTESGENVHVEAIYPTLTNSDIYPLLRDSLLILLGFAALTLVSALGLYFHRGTPHEAPQPFPGSEPAVASRESDDYGTDFVDDLQSESDDPDDTDDPDESDDDIMRELDERFDDSQDSSNASDREKAKLLRRLGSELERSTFNEEDLVLALLRPSSTDPENETEVDSDSTTDRFNDEVRTRDRLYSFIALEHAFKELTFTLGDNIIAIIEPNNDLDGGMRRMENLLRKADERAITEGGKLHGGLSARAGRLTESPRLFKEAYTALRRAEYQKARLMAFRPDPDLYRRFVAGEEASVEST